jgi:hypothetical protein
LFRSRLYQGCQHQLTAGQHYSLRTRLRPTHARMYIYRKRGDWINCKAIMIRERANDTVVGRTKLSKSQRMTGLLCAAFKLISYSLLTFSVLRSCHIMFCRPIIIMSVKLSYCGILGEWGSQTLPLGAACWPALVHTVT